MSNGGSGVSSSVGASVTSSGAPKPRSLRFTWNMKTTSAMDPADMMSEIREILDNNNCDYEQRERFLLLCTYQDVSGVSSVGGVEGNVIQWEMEVRILSFRFC